MYSWIAARDEFVHALLDGLSKANNSENREATALAKGCLAVCRRRPRRSVSAAAQLLAAAAGHAKRPAPLLRARSIIRSLGCPLTALWEARSAQAGRSANPVRHD